MGYASQSDCTGEFKDLTITADSAITTADILGFIEDADAEINSRLSTKYLTPITGTEALLVMKMIEVWLVKHRIMDITTVKTGVSTTSQVGIKSYRQMALDLMDGLVSGKSKLTDATLASANDGVKSYSSTNSIENIFDITTNQW